MSRWFGSVAVATLVLGLAACGTTTVDTEPSTTVPGATTTAPTGTVDDLLGRLKDRVFLLSLAIADGQGSPALDAIEALWAAASAQLPRTEFVDRVSHQIGLMSAAVDRRRAADADKAARNVGVLIDAR